METIYENESTPKKDGYRMPAEFEPQECIWMLWPHRTDNWRDGAKPAQRAFTDVARGIAQYEPVVVGVNPETTPRRTTCWPTRRTSSWWR
ncbi:agmatine deiminase family protein [Eggerthella sinensis]|uniref:agmatine deiminase family protein n=1 Tax=Eggerthella sinensis TaxID=242230 RepID=UPI0022E40346|nr:agmatine deiminase family protein [Eggerthella sinensis]